ncbi:hypothetical protein GCM10010510_20420 [Streptomyces anandii JCM 4720]|nr:hypothetical protein GCM10010510_20420 [Streptomyces anandii JCM 4720]
MHGAGVSVAGAADTRRDGARVPGAQTQARRCPDTDAGPQMPRMRARGDAARGVPGHRATGPPGHRLTGSGARKGPALCWAEDRTLGVLGRPLDAAAR